MSQLDTMLAKAEKSSFQRYLLNLGLWRMIPFNKPHKIKVISGGNGRSHITLPYIRRNFNHIKGLHACALATLAEYATGLAVLTSIDSKKYRIIMQKLEMDYRYQGKSDASVRYDISSDPQFDDKKRSIENGEAEVFECKPEIYDQENNLLAKASISWHVKSWEQVKTKVE